MTINDPIFDLRRRQVVECGEQPEVLPRVEAPVHRALIREHDADLSARELKWPDDIVSMEWDRSRIRGDQSGHV